MDRARASNRSVPAGECVDVEVRLDAGSLEVGDYAALLQLVTDDPARPLTTLDVSFHVLDAVVVELQISPKKINTGGHKKRVKAKLEQFGPYSETDVVISTVRLNGVVPADPTHGRPSPGTLRAPHT